MEDNKYYSHTIGSKSLFISFLSNYYKLYYRYTYKNKILNEELAFLINYQCFNICINTKVEFYDCFDNCEIKYMSSKFIQDGLKF